MFLLQDYSKAWSHSTYLVGHTAFIIFSLNQDSKENSVNTYMIIIKEFQMSFSICSEHLKPVKHCMTTRYEITKHVQTGALA